MFKERTWFQWRKREFQCRNRKYRKWKFHRVKHDDWNKKKSLDRLKGRLEMTEEILGELEDGSIGIILSEE